MDVKLHNGTAQTSRCTARWLQRPKVNVFRNENVEIVLAHLHVKWIDSQIQQMV